VTRESAAGGDIGYLLRDIEVTPLRFHLKNPVHAELAGPDAAVASFVRDHPGAQVNDLWTGVPVLGNRSYAEAREVVVRLVDLGVLEPRGQLPLEEVDVRYERVPACDLCGAPSAGHEVVLWKYNTPVVRCSGCGLLYANPRWKAEYLFGRYDSAYWEHYSDKLDRELQQTEAARRWKPYLYDLGPARQTGRLLDVGCATGEFLAAAGHAGWEIYGVETSAQAAALAGSRAGAQVHNGTLDTAPYPDGWFDAVTLWDVLEHVQSPSSYVKQIARLLRPGGYFALTTPNVGGVTYRLIGRDWWVVGPNDHIYYYAPGTLKRLLAGSGFEVLTMQSLDVQIDSWRQILRHPAAMRHAPRLEKVMRPLVRRLLLGDELYALARRV
jgi:SAM-dependent methyltransferase